MIPESCDSPSTPHWSSNPRQVDDSSAARHAHLLDDPAGHLARFAVVARTTTQRLPDGWKPGAQRSTTLLGAQDGKLALGVADEAAEETLLDKTGERGLDVGKRGLAMAEKDALGWREGCCRMSENETLTAARRSQQVVNTKRRRLARVWIAGKLIGEEEDATCEGAPDEHFAAVEQGKEDAPGEEPAVVTLLGTEGCFQGRNVSLSDGLTDGKESGSETDAFGALEQFLRGEATEKEIRRDEIDDNETLLFAAAGMTLVIGGLETALRTEKVIIGKEEATEVVEIGDSLTGRIQRQSR